MNYVLDTNVISELIARQPNQTVVDWRASRRFPACGSVVLFILRVVQFPLAERKLHYTIESSTALPKANGCLMYAPESWVNMQEDFVDRVIMLL